MPTKYAEACDIFMQEKLLIEIHLKLWMAFRIAHVPPVTDSNRKQFSILKLVQTDLKHSVLNAKAVFFFQQSDFQRIIICLLKRYHISRILGEADSFLRHDLFYFLFYFTRIFEYNVYESLWSIFKFLLYIKGT